MKLEPGKYYRTRDGRKAFVGWRMPDDDLSATHPWVGNVEGYGIFGWTDSGQNGHRGDHNQDLIEEWKEPEVYEFEAKWHKCIQHGAFFPRCDDLGPNLESLIGKRTKVRIEVKE